LPRRACCITKTSNNKELIRRKSHGMSKKKKKKRERELHFQYLACGKKKRHNFSILRVLCYPSEMLLVQVSACLEWLYIGILRS